MRWHPHRDPLIAEYDEDVIYAVRAFEKGIASDGQQRLVWAWLMYVSGVSDQAYRPGGLEGQRATDFACGKQFVAHQFAKMLSPDVLDGLKRETEKSARRSSGPTEYSRRLRYEERGNNG